MFERTFSILIASAALAQTPVREAPPPAAPARIRVGSAPQSPCVGSKWICGHPDAAQLAADERQVQTNPEDICARGELIAHLPPGQARVEHLLWMIRHHPEWDGFTVNPRLEFGGLNYAPERDRIVEIAEAWKEQIGTNQQRAIVLHNAAVFFMRRDRELAVSLLKRAIALEPDEPLFVDRLGMAYGYTLVSPVCAEKNTAAVTPALAAEAREALTHSDDRVLIAGALSVNILKDTCFPAGIDIRARLRALPPNVAGRERSSQSSPYTKTQCPAR